MHSRLLYVDDEQINLMLFRIILQDNYEVVISESGASGLEILRENKDIRGVICDLRMPGMSGIEFIMRARELNDQIPYFILSGYERTEEINLLIDNGTIKAFFQKPTVKEEILKALEEQGIG